MMMHEGKKETQKNVKISLNKILKQKANNIQNTKPENLHSKYHSTAKYSTLVFFLNCPVSF